MTHRLQPSLPLPLLCLGMSSASFDDDELEFQSNPLAQSNPMASASTADEDELEFTANPLREVSRSRAQLCSSESERDAVGSHALLTLCSVCLSTQRLMGLDSDDLNDGSQQKPQAPAKPAATAAATSAAKATRSFSTEKCPVSSVSQSSTPFSSAAADSDEWAARRAWLRANLPSTEVMSAVTLLSLLLNLLLLLLVIPSLRSDVSYLSGRSDSLHQTVSNLNSIVAGMGSRIDGAQAQILGFHATADAVLHRVALASSALDLKVANAYPHAQAESKRPAAAAAADRCGN